MIRALMLLCPALLLTLAACDGPKGQTQADNPARSVAVATSKLRYAGRWAESAALCESKWFDFGADQLRTRDNLSCIFQRETPTASGIDIEVACIGDGVSSVEQWSLGEMPEDRMSMIRDNQPPILLTRCPEI
jgi:hypothetical protein